ncbi:choline dehydrogenase [Pedobacter cryoconitis]|uniref:Choline dehydrogenase n=1 Tax=Pedobacter cryoconitis TaxID=188932 RepID=A0A7W9E240_9SPHI|nr:GMC family oxidoreductase N-terminal domain-containing protein [Pedobacter cryoconitis]MBB5638320.1 choline dehydrogenase [Pedobacter cryoconitis]
MTTKKENSNQSSEDAKDQVNKHYDYIIVGGGSAGCVIARRLVESNKFTVLLIEAGESGEGIDTILNPARWLENIGSVQDYLYQYSPSPLLNNRLIYAPRGKVLGGSGSINGMIWSRGNKDDYDGWAAAGNQGWDYNSVLPLFKKAEDWEGGESMFHGAGGPISIGNTKYLHPIDSSFIAAAKSFGIPYLADINGPAPEGAAPLCLNIKDGIRCSPYSGYLKPVLESLNLTVITGANVNELTIENGACVGLIYTKDAKIHHVSTSQEVILCAGVFETPRLLMLSGIGDENDLKELDINVKFNLPGVGKNLQDHPLVSLTYQANKPIDYFTYNLGGSNLYWKSRPELPNSDINLIPIQVPIMSAEIADHVQLPENCFSVFATLVSVNSRGFVKLQSKDPSAQLIIQPNLLADERDMEAMINAVELCMKIVSQQPMQNIIKSWVAPKSGIDRDDIKAFVKNACSTYFHPVGSCAMGSDIDSVVNNKLQVYGITGLRIADASIMPRITTSNTNAPTVMIGEFAAQLILKKR